MGHTGKFQKKTKRKKKKNEGEYKSIPIHL